MRRSARGVSVVSSDRWPRGATRRPSSTNSTSSTSRHRWRHLSSASSLAGPIGTDRQAATSSRKGIDKAAVGGRLSGASPSALAHDHMGRFASVATWATGRFGPAEHIPPSLFKDDATGKPRASKGSPQKPRHRARARLGSEGIRPTRKQRGHWERTPMGTRGTLRPAPRRLR